MNPERALKIFLVDDDTDFLKLMGALLERRGHEVILSHAGTNAAIEIPDVKPDAVVTDWVMVGLDGLELITELREGGECPETKMILVSGRLDGTTDEDARAADLDGYIRKPIDPAAFAETVERLILG